MNSGWCTDVISQHCSPSLEYLYINSKPFYLPREVASFFLAAVFIPPQASMQGLERTLRSDIE